jgi:hypothetical protein
MIDMMIFILFLITISITHIEKFKSKIATNSQEIILIK